jgi:hypothetical protein
MVLSKWNVLQKKQFDMETVDTWLSSFRVLNAGLHDNQVKVTELVHRTQRLTFLVPEAHLSARCRRDALLTSTVTTDSSILFLAAGNYHKKVISSVISRHA